MCGDEQKKKMLAELKSLIFKLENNEIEGCALISFDKNGETIHSVGCPNELVPMMLFNLEIMKASMLSGAMAQNKLSFHDNVS